MEEKDLALLEKNLQDLFKTVYPDYFSSQTLMLPEDYCKHLLTGDLSNVGGEWGFFWYDQDQVFRETKYWCDIWADHLKKEHSIWICIAHWSDKHDIWLCCDAKSRDFGMVVDCHDSHPWEPSGAFTDPEGSFSDFISDWKNDLPENITEGD